MTKRPNIILITFDDCRADRLGVAGCKKNLTPFLDSLAREGTYFPRAYATGSGSPQSFVGTMTSTYPLDYGGFSYIDKPRVLVSEALQKAGYKTMAVHSAAYMSDYFGYNRGWDVFNYLSHFKDGGTMAGIRKETVQAKILHRISAIRRWLKERLPFFAPVFGFFEKTALFLRKIASDTKDFTPPFFLGNEVNREIKKLLPERPPYPVFLWAHYMDVHEPLGFFWRNGQGLWKKIKYHVGDIALFLFGEAPRLNRIFKSLYEELYDASLRSVDGHIGEMVHYLKSRGILEEDDALIVLSDHGEEFFEKGAFGHEQRPFNVNLNVPLIVRSPKRVGAGASPHPVSLIDVSPTIAEFAHAFKPKTWKGRSLFDEPGRDVVSQIIDCEGDLTNPEFIGATLISHGHKFINFRGKEMLFSMDDMAEKKDLCAEKPEVVRLLKSRLKKYTPAKFLDA
ncbi:MAG: sulfatase [Candidatus Liptonbacteria bacterium]|nr:sulfatase [Parcubacteria group bacterium]MBI4087326.1 sulfatase [Candidatus Liptonbacteria bacterium]